MCSTSTHLIVAPRLAARACCSERPPASCEALLFHLSLWREIQMDDVMRMPIPGSFPSGAMTSVVENLDLSVGNHPELTSSIVEAFSQMVKQSCCASLALQKGTYQKRLSLRFGLPLVSSRAGDVCHMFGLLSRPATQGQGTPDKTHAIEGRAHLLFTVHYETPPGFSLNEQTVDIPRDRGTRSYV